MTGLKQPIINITKLEQVCMVVRNLEKSMESMWNTFGIGPWEIHEVDADSMTDMTYRGKPGRFSFKAAWTREKVGGIQIELIQPVEGDNIYSDFLKEHGEGIHHIAWYRVDDLETFAQTTLALEAAGFPCIMSGRTLEVAFTYFDTNKVLNTIFEVVWENPSVPPHPSRVFP